MLINIDNKDIVDFINNWSVGGRTSHVNIRRLFISEMK